MSRVKHHGVHGHTHTHTHTHSHAHTQVKESPAVPSDSLLTVDLKSGSKINIGTQAITLDRFFEGNLKATKSLDLGNR